jgi:hypothetical protein
MPPETVFSYASSAAVLGWGLLILGPRRFGWFNALTLWVIPLGLSVVYAVLVLSRFSGIGGGFDTLANVRVLFMDDWALIAGWVHFLAFDLFVGAVMAARMDRFAVSRVVQAPILAATFMLGPLGFLIAALTEAGLRLFLLPRRLPVSKGSSHVPT